MLIRFRLYHDTGSAANMRFGNFKLSTSLTQREARDALYEFMRRSSVVSFNRDHLGVLYHNLVESILCTKPPSTSILAGPCDWHLLITVLRGDGSFYTNANRLAKQCASWQWDLRCIRLHKAIIDAFGGNGYSSQLISSTAELSQERVNITTQPVQQERRTSSNPEVSGPGKLSPIDLYGGNAWKIVLDDEDPYEGDQEADDDDLLPEDGIWKPDADWRPVTQEPTDDFEYELVDLSNAMDGTDILR